MSRTKLESLTPEQEALIPIVRDEWLNLFHDEGPQRMNRPDVEEGIEWLYGLAGLDKPLVVFVESPMGCQLAPHFFRQMGKEDVLRDIRTNSVWHSVRDSVWDSVWDSVMASVGRSVGHSVMNSVMASVGRSVRHSVRHSVMNSVMASVEDSVRHSVRDSVMDSVGRSVRDSVMDSVIKYEPFSWCCFAYDSDWAAFYSYWERISIFKHEEFERYIKYLKATPFMAVFLEGLAVVCEPPQYIQRDSEGRLHCETGPALEWLDGFKLYFWHGVEVGEDLIMHPERVTREDILREGNAEKRRCIMEKLEGRFAELLGLETLDIGVLNGSEVMLLRTKEKDDIVDDYLYFVRVLCPSTGRMYHLPIPKHSDALDGLAWTFGLDKEGYKPVVET